MLLSTILLCGAVFLADTDPAVETARPAVIKGIAYIEARGLAWKNEHGCASCHHVPMMVWTLNDAKGAGFPVNVDLLHDMSTWLASEDNAAGLIPGEKAMNPYSLAAMYSAIALQSRSETTAPPARLIAHIATNQLKDGSWASPDGRPPLLASHEAATMLSELALLRSEKADFRANTDAATLWVNSQAPADDAQVRSLRLTLAAARGEDLRTITALIDAITSHQNPDGGWSQTPDLPSDGYATGQALYALASAHCGYRFPPSMRGMTFLENSQQADGSWLMTSRPVATGGGSAKNLEPITYAGTAWALLGLIRATTLP